MTSGRPRVAHRRPHHVHPSSAGIVDRVDFDHQALRADGAGPGIQRALDFKVGLDGEVLPRPGETATKTATT
jgi:hypothetical protein